MAAKSLPPKAPVPQLATPLKDASVEEGKPVELVVAVQPAAEPVDVLWTKDKKPLTPDAKVGFLYASCCALHVAFSKVQ